ncbi:polysaccharide deacetylase family protein [Quadrisphaera sp. INWT6]|uniref:polysaccharide deacetylase family protein n=1 Tax=Quadrisphaera sp. INWT6 TaxID=2596917 RepID=UPI00189258AA|nr:polysaccharide deacetylase family protein [Quadrisphaera sp. INWT6]
MSARLVRRRHLGGFEAAGACLPAPSRGGALGGAALLRASSVHCVDPRPGEGEVVALTWDDGPHPEHTPAVLDALAQDGTTATFFVLALAAEQHPHLVARILAEGHEVELHGVDHARLTELSDRRAVARVREARDRLAQVTGRPARYFRPAFGAHTVPFVVGVRALGLVPVLWSAWGQDWLDDDAGAAAQRALDATHPGAVVLLHDAFGEALTDPSNPGPDLDRGAVARQVLAGLRERGASALPLGRLLEGRTAVVTAGAPQLVSLRSRA